MADIRSNSNKVTGIPADTDISWYAVYTRPRAEKLVFQRIQETGIEVFLPMQKTIRQWSDRKKVIEKPLLSSYIFVKTKPKLFPLVFRIFQYTNSGISLCILFQYSRGVVRGAIIKDDKLKILERLK